MRTSRNAGTFYRSSIGSVCVQQINIPLRPLFIFLPLAEFDSIIICTTMDAMCDIPDDVRRELDLVHADVGTYINMDKMRTLSYASLDYLAILDTLKHNIPQYNFNFLRMPTPLGECARTSNIGTVLAHSGRVDVVKDDFHAFFVHLIDDEKHVIRMEEDKRSFDDGHAFQAIIAQL